MEGYLNWQVRRMVFSVMMMLMVIRGMPGQDAWRLQAPSPGPLDNNSIIIGCLPDAFQGIPNGVGMTLLLPFPPRLLLLWRHHWPLQPPCHRELPCPPPVKVLTVA